MDVREIQVITEANNVIFGHHSSTAATSSFEK